MIRILLIVSVALLSGCATVLEQFENRAACTVGKDQAFVISMYGPLGIASKISEKDLDSFCSKGETK